MSDDVGRVLSTIGFTMRDPDGAAKLVLSHRYDRTTLWMLLIAVTAAGAIIPGLLTLISPGGPSMLYPGMTPITFALVQGSFGVVSAFALFYFGRTLGGEGSFTDCLMVVIWLAVVGLAFQVLQLGSLLLGSAGIISIVTFVVFGWQLYIFTHFVNVLHSFDSLLKSFGLLVLISIGVIFGVAMILAMLGLSVPVGV